MSKHTPGPWEFDGISDFDEERGSAFIVGSNLGGLVGAALPWPTELRRLGYRILSLEHELAAEKAAHEKSEARVRELESELSRAVEEIEALIKGGNMGLMNLLATRKKEESRG